MPISSLELKEFLGQPFVECGSAGGEGIKAALKAGFNRVYSIDIDLTCYENCNKIFKEDPRVNLSFGDCGTWLDGVLNIINEACVIYLDANGWIGEKESPFHACINAILRNQRKDHTILIDDINHAFRPQNEIIRDLRWSRVYGSGGDIIRQVLRINNNYNLYVIDTHSENLERTYPSWVLVASPNKTRIDVEYI